MKASIICIGDEILSGKTLDTNSNLIASALDSIGIRTINIKCIPDNIDEITNEIIISLEKSDITITTGGLGPTNDDMTKKALCQVFDDQLIIHEESLQNIQKMLKKRGRSINKNNYEQALIPSGAKVFLNKTGTAPGILIEKEGKCLISLPGVPYETKYLIENEVLNFLSKKCSSQFIHRFVMISGIAEAVLAEKLAEWERGLPDFIKPAFLPQAGIIYIRLSVYEKIIDIDNILEYELKKLELYIPEFIVAYTDKSIIELLHQKAIDKNISISTAESCTGGKISNSLITMPGSSKYYRGSIVAYDNEVKIKMLNVSESILQNFGAVSEQVVEIMADSAKQIFNTDFSVSVSGIAGPDGGSNEKPVGTAWIGISGKNRTISRKFVFSNIRDLNISFFTNMALVMLYKEMSN